MRALAPAAALAVVAIGAPLSVPNAPVSAQEAAYTAPRFYDGNPT